MIQKYNVAVEKLKSIKENYKNKLIALGFTSNLDVICEFDIEIFNDLIKKYLFDFDLKKIKRAKIITNKSELIESILWFLLNGVGGEVDIADENLILEEFNYSYAMGGTATQAALALNEFKVPSLVHITDDSKEVREILNEESIFCAFDKETLIKSINVKSINGTQINTILQYKKGDILIVNNEKIKIKESNRIILTNVTVNKTMPLNDEFFNYLTNNSKKIPSYVVSSFNCIDDESVLDRVLEKVIDSIKKYKENNPMGVVFFENAHFHSVYIYLKCIKILFKEVDIVSMNEEELDYLLKMYKLNYNIDNPHEMIEALENLKTIFMCKMGIIIHSKQFSLYFGKENAYNIEEGLCFGNLLAGSKTLTKGYGDISLIKELNKLPLSKHGSELRSYFINNKNIIVVPTKVIDKPKYTIGLGDTFIAGLQLCFNK